MKVFMNYVFFNDARNSIQLPKKYSILDTLAKKLFYPVKLTPYITTLQTGRAANVSCVAPIFTLCFYY